ncbi:cell division protein FtsQ/DivIB [Desulforhopalus sp. 52FAK]
MRLYSRIKNILSLSTDTTKKRSYQSGDISFGGVSTKNEQFSTSKSRLSFIKRFTRLRHHTDQNIYSPQVKKSGGMKIGRKVLCLGALGFFWMLGGDIVKQRLEEVEFFKVTELSISGESVLSKEELRTTAGIIIHQSSLLGLDIANIEEKLQANPWIAKATVERNWPSGVDIDIVENIPLALLHINTANGTELRYIDKRGNSFLTLTPGGKIDFPIVTGLTEIQDETKRDEALSEVLIFLNKARRNDPHLPVQSLSEVHVTQDGNLVVYLVEYPFPIFFGNGNTKQKYGRLVEVLKALYKKEKGKDLISEVEYIQMDYLQDKVLVAQSGQG